ncbi:type II toxin-antitoxin system mRNA interferase toxin, RelE/StbE family [Patescibacteria group bacterium]|nr:type II toxin-antitoxin system mRNA interferase toxin, RelE/StbE family [Patescibacteria group bacterium]MBU4016900.1 type II toxin-antitoxin system mRNA interferase toxin, RelE/StbE family [Patescibacteria group bacterium]MBU4099610.1 type II toxin-antitoxin system mRNA interferase toxin, RelE/StbE family [Patescibacteria group bacterium]
MKVKYTKTFAKQYDKANIKIQKTFKERLKLFSEDPRSPQLRNHLLKGTYKGYRSINITGDWRAIYREIQKEENDEIYAYFSFLGTHSQLYR